MSRAELDDRVSRALLHMIRKAEEALERSARQRGLHPTDFRCIGYLRMQNGPVSPKDIIAYLGVTSGAGTALLDRLETSGFIRRVRNPEDRRSVLIVLDRDAAADPVALHERIEQKYFAATEDLSDDNLQAIATYLERIEQLSEEMNDALYDNAVPISVVS